MKAPLSVWAFLNPSPLPFLAGRGFKENRFEQEPPAIGGISIYERSMAGPQDRRLGDRAVSASCRDPKME